MRIKFEIELRRPARRTVAVLLGVLLLAAPAAVLASHQFPDVPDSNPFHDEISAIAEAGITTGFADGGYHPGDPVTRQAMAAFMQRGFGRVGLVVGTTPMTSSLTVNAGNSTSAVVPVRQLTITVPGASNAFGPTQLVHLQGRVAFFTSMSNSGKGCPCEFRAAIRDTVTPAVSPSQLQTFVTDPTVNSYRYSIDVEALFAAPPGARTYQLEVALNLREGTVNAATFNLSNTSSLSAMTFPFGPTGTSDF